VQADVVNRGMSGYNSRWGLQVLPQALADQGCSSSSSSSGGSAQDDEQPASHQSQPARHQRQGCNVQLLVIWYGTNDAAVPDRRE
jgi:lysophospholipase L1-like esterase